jgi:glycosyltransferase involved in cell wall biosynthesis
MTATQAIDAGTLAETAESLPSLNIVFITKADLPEGQGHTARLKTFVRALTLLGHRVSIWNQHSLGVVPESKQMVEGQLDGVNYRYVLGTLERGYGIRSLGTKLGAMRVIARDMRAGRQSERIDIVCFNQLSFLDAYPLMLLARSLGIPTIQAYEDELWDRESPRSAAVGHPLFPVDAWLADRYCPRLADAIVVISRYLQDKYARLKGSSEDVVLVPTIVDCEAWASPAEENTETPTILYAGSFHSPEPIEAIIDSLSILRTQGKRFRMVMLGENLRDPERMNGIRTRIEGHLLSSMVEMPGFVPAEKVREHVRNANILLCIRKDGELSRSGLSTKLSESLASGRMVITSDVGDVNRYLKHRESAMILPATATPEEIAASIGEGLGSYELRRRTGMGGREAAWRFFDLSCAKLILTDLLLKIIGRHRARSH